MPYGMYQNIFRVWLIVNGITDLVVFGAAPILFPEVVLPGMTLLTCFPSLGDSYTVTHRAFAYGFMMCGFCRFSAGWNKTPSAATLATLSYLMELFLFSIEVFKYKTSTIEAALPAIATCVLCSVILLFGILDDDESKAKTT